MRSGWIGIIAMDGYNAGPALSAYLQRPVFYLDIHRTGSYCIWKQSFFPPVRATLSGEFAISGWLSAFSRFILVSNRPVPAEERVIEAGGAVFRLHELARFEHSIVQSENYYLYEATRETEKNKE